MAASSSNCYYDVFLSFRGEDTRNNFTDRLYTALIRRDILTFRDEDSASKGENLNSELEKAIHNSKSSIVVLSKDYASSTWCLDELVMILDKKKSSEFFRSRDAKFRKHHVLPVFYDVKPSHLRDQKGTVGESFVRYEKQVEEEADYERKRGLVEKVKRWRSALTEVANLIGLELQNHHSGSEVKFVDKIIAVIEDKLKRISLHVAQYEIDLESRAKIINRWVQDETSDDSVIVICGMGGIGKTTIAKYVYNLNTVCFDGSSFLANVGEVLKQPNGLVSLQTQLLSNISHEELGKIYNYDQGLAKIENLLRSKRVLIVLDNVDHADQIYDICGILQDWLFKGSKVIITSRHERLLKPYQIIRVDKFGIDESIKLFSLHAFGEDLPTKNYTELTKRVAQICEGIPLALKVIASSLSGRSEEEWGWELEKLEAIPHNDIHTKLKTSFDLLQDDDRTIFLHIACFFVGKDRDYVIKILDKCNLYAKNGVQNLINRCLLERDSSKVLKMHRLIRDMGRDLVRQESQDPGERSRLWLHQDIFKVLKNETGTKKVEGLTFDMRMMENSHNNAKRSRYEESVDNWGLLKYVNSFFWQSSNTNYASPDDVYLRTNAFDSLINLKLLSLKYVKLIGKYDNFPKGIVWLSWHGFSLDFLPHELALQNLVILDLRHSKLRQVWKKTPFLESLKILDVSYSERLERTPNFFGLPNLEKLILKGCVSLVEVCDSIDSLEMLELLDLSYCKALCKLPMNLQKLESLKTVKMSGCNINGVSSEMKNVMSLGMVKQFWSSGSTPKIGPQTLWASLPFSLRELYLGNCNLSDDSFPQNFSNVPSLQVLDLSENPFRELPNCIKSLTGLKQLDLICCNGLQSVDLNGLQSDLREVMIVKCPSVKKITSPQHVIHSLNIYDCYNLNEIEGYIKNSPTDMINNSLTQVPNQIFMEFGITNYLVSPSRESSFALDYERTDGWAIIFEVPVTCFTIQYLNLFCNFDYKITDDVHVGEEYLIPFCQDLFVQIKNHTKDLTWMYMPRTVLRTPFEDNWEWGSRWSFGNQLEAGDLLIVTFHPDIKRVKVNECGYKIVYHEEGNITSSNLENSRHHFPEFRLRTGEYILFQEYSQNPNQNFWLQKHRK